VNRMADPGFSTHGKDCIQRNRLIKGEDPDSTDTAPGMFLELWEDDRGDRNWAVAYLDDYRPHLGSGIRIRVSDDVAGWMQRNHADLEGEQDG